MKIRSALAPGALKLGKHIRDISKEAYNRLKWFDYHEAVGKNARKTCRQAIGFYWFQGHVVCGLCGRHYRAKSQLVKSKGIKGIGLLNNLSHQSQAPGSGNRAD